MYTFCQYRFNLMWSFIYLGFFLHIIKTFMSPVATFVHITQLLNKQYVCLRNMYESQYFLIGGQIPAEKNN